MNPYVSALYRYPLKSGAGQKLNSMTISPYGPEGDRIFMLVDGSGNFISQRPPQGKGSLALIKTDISDSDVITFSMNGNADLRLMKADIQTIPSKLREVTVHDKKCHGYDMGDRAAEWFQYRLGIKCRLIAYAADNPRFVDPDYAQEGDKVGFADGMQVLFTSTSSLNSLYEISATAYFGMDRFRPNIVIDGLPAWQEDVVARVKVGGAVFEFVKPCSRCVMTAIDQQTGARDKAPHPYGILGDLRKGEGGGLSGRFFGQNAAFRGGEKIINVGQPVEILEVKPMHPAVSQAKLKYNLT